MKRLNINYDNCIGCDLCSIQCSWEKTGTVNPSLARIHIVRVEEEGIMMPAVCRHCEDPLCLPACPEDDCITVDPESGLIRVDEVICTGCKKCAKACPYEGPVTIPVTDRKSKNLKAICDLCDGDPACVAVCPSGTLWYGEPDSKAKERAIQAELRLSTILKELVRRK